LRFERRELIMLFGGATVRSEITSAQQSAVRRAVVLIGAAKMSMVLGWLAAFLKFRQPSVCALTSQSNMGNP
jgi:hypothetical protein